jgi:hypothetical protein
MSNWIFEYQGKPREAAVIQNGMVKYRNLDAGPDLPYVMDVDRWQALPQVYVDCDENGECALVGTDCCDGAKHECRTGTIYDPDGTPNVTLCRAPHGCSAGR